MAKLENIVGYLIAHYPNHDDLSNARLTKMVYLADWKHAITMGRPISEIPWYFNNFGPFVSDVKRVAEQYPSVFTLRESATMFGNPKTIIGLKPGGYDLAALDTSFAISERDAMDHVIQTTAPLTYDAFIRLVYSTYPILKSERYSYLNLPELALEYQEFLAGQPA